MVDDEGPTGPSIDDILASAVPRTAEVQLCARQDLVDRHAAVVQELNAVLPEVGDTLASGVDQAEVDRLSQELAEFENEQAAHTATVTLHSVSALDWADLLRAHPPQSRDRGLMWDPRTFPPACVAACSTLTDNQATRMFKTFPAGEWARLFMAAINLNEGVLPHPKLQAATDLLRANNGSSTMPDLGESLAEPSSAGSGKQ